MKRKPSKVVELETELLRLNELVRARRKQLSRLAACPNKNCECRQIWREVVEDRLANQVSKIRLGVAGNGVSAKAAAGKSAKKSVKKSVKKSTH